MEARERAGLGGTPGGGTWREKKKEEGREGRTQKRVCTKGTRGERGKGGFDSILFTAHLLRAGHETTVEHGVRVIADVGHAHRVSITAARVSRRGGRHVYELIALRRHPAKGSWPPPVREPYDPKRKEKKGQGEEYGAEPQGRHRAGRRWSLG